MNTTKINSSAGESSTFSPIRFAAYFRLYVSSSRRKLLLSVGQMVVITFVFMIFLYYTGGKDRYSIIGNEDIGSYDMMWDMCNEIVMMFGVVFSTFAGSMMYSSVSSKKTRLTTFEIPASQFEKFLTWWLIYVPIFIVVMLASFYLADVMRVLWIKLGSDYGAYAHVIPLKNLLTFSVPEFPGADAPHVPAYQTRLMTLMIYGAILILNSVFSLGSIFLHKLSFLKTVIFMFGFMIMVSILSSIGVTFFYGGDAFEMKSRLVAEDVSTIWILSSIIGVIGCYLYWLGYARYKDTEIVNRW